MARRDIIVVGTSAGGVEALLVFVKSLPEDFKAAVFIVLHLSPVSSSNLPHILSRASAITAVHPTDGEIIDQGKIYIAPPDRHLVLTNGGRIAISKGPKENRLRPSIDALFRSAALVYGPRVIGVVLSGMLGDGTAGMAAIKRNGGLALVQDPDDALFPSMPQHVMQCVAVDHSLPASDLGHLVAGLATTRAPEWPQRSKEEMELLKRKY